MKKGPWTRDEDQKLLAFIQQHGQGSWRTLPQKAGLERCGKSCRLRWTNYLRPDIKRGKFSSHEEKSIIRLHALLGNRWSVIAAHVPNRTDNEIKNYWNTRLKKRLTRMGIDPTTHKPKNNQAATVSHMAQWETARLEAEARLARVSNLQRATVPFPPSYLRSCCFFNSPSLESPTSTLNNVTVPTVEENDVAEMRGKMENSLPAQNDDAIHACNVMIGSSYNHDSMVGSVLEERDDEMINYWNELLDLVNSSRTL